MVLLEADKISKSYTEKPLLTEIEFSIHEGEKIGLIGVNGAGKSTLLKIVAKAEEHESGNMIRSNELKTAYLSQNPPYEKTATVEEQVRAYINDSEVKDYQYKALLTKLGIFDYDQKMGTLSGGQRKRVALAAVLSAKTNLLILDEPTNHMDDDVIEWLESYLINYKGAIFMTTHDRYFLDRVTNKIIEIDKGKAYSYDGNYDYFLESKAAREEIALATERKRYTMYKKELAWMRRGAQARSTKAKGRVQQFQQLEESMLVVDDSKLELDTVSSRLGKKIIEFIDVSKAYGPKQLITDFSYMVLRNDRIGIIGPNGCGKSTLLKIMMGELEPDAGRVEMGATVKIAYFSQENEVLDLDKRVIQYISEIAGSVKTAEGNFSASQMLERFLFPSHMHSVEIGRLSGGEKRRLYLLSILMEAPNVIVLDEPTNDLDIETLTILEDYLDSFNGAVITVSHDRYFLDRIAIRTFAFEEDGSILHSIGGYTDYSERKKQRQKEFVQKKNRQTADSKENNFRSKSRKLKFSFHEQKEWDTIEDDIAGLEEELETITEQMNHHGSDYGKLRELTEKKESLEVQLNDKMERWEYLSELWEKIKEQ